MAVLLNFRPIPAVSHILQSGDVDVSAGIRISKGDDA